VNPQHLFLGTHADNMADKSRKGRHNRQILTGEQVAEIISLCTARFLTQRQIAARYAVSLSTVNATFKGRNNRHLPRGEEVPNAVQR